MLGMLAAHTGFSAEFDWLQPATWPSLVHGRSSILFAFIAGVSLSLMTGQRTSRPVEETRVVRLRIVGRGVAILVIGLVLEVLGSPIDVILTMYGVLFIIAVPFLGWSTRRLLISTAVLVAAGPPLLALAKSLVGSTTDPGVALLIFGTYPVTVWIALLFAGVIVGRLRLDSAMVAVKLLVIGAVLATVGYGVGVIAQPSGSWQGDASYSKVDTSSVASSITPDELAGWNCADGGFSGVVECYAPEALTGPGLIADDPAAELTPLGGFVDRLQHPDWEGAAIALGAWEQHTGGTMELLGSGGLAVAVLGLCLLLGRAAPRLLSPLGAVGSMPLTAYSVHVLMFALGLQLLLPSGGLTWLVLSAALVVMAMVWRRFAGTGPLERLARRIGDIFADAPRRTDSRVAAERAQPSSN